jgi:peptide-methionine (S)-S-oxide reductase
MKSAALPFSLLLCIVSFSFCSPINKDGEQKKNAIEGHAKNKDLSRFKTATFASGCFWCMEYVFESVKGVEEAVSGYSGGKEKNPTYHEVGSGNTGHAESVQVYYDSTKVNFATLVKVYFASQDPTQVNGQGPDHGRQYRSIIFYNDIKEKQIAEKYISELNQSKKLEGPVAAQLLQFQKFWPAEDYHQNYVVLHPDEGYVQHESIPRIKKFQSKYPELVKPEKLLK